jgi:hypothetical protein
MSHYRIRQIIRSAVTVALLVTVLVTTFAQQGFTRSQAAPSAPDRAANPIPASVGAEVAELARLRRSAPVVPINALVFSAPGQADALSAALAEAGSTVHIRQGDALFVGVDRLGEVDFASLGARAAYQGVITDDDLAALSGADHDTALIWNQMTTSAVTDLAALSIADGGADSRMMVITDTPTDDGGAALFAPTNLQTSLFMAGKVSVKVLFVESTSGPETWTEAEVGKVKTEINQALEWWAIAATTPEGSGQPARPSAQLEWQVSYVSPFDGATEDRTKIQVGTEPIEGDVFVAATTWIPGVAAAFGAANVRQLAHDTRVADGSDWGFVLYVVDSSADADGRFDDDQKVAGAALNGPWAVVTYDGGDLSIDNLNIIMAKMVGHVFGAGDETYDTTTDTGCHNDEIYGYLSITHDNCEKDNLSPANSLMRDGNAMVSAYQQHELSDSARAQVGWRDTDDDGVYDALDTLSDTFAGFSPDPVCPELHLSDVAIDNVPALPPGVTDPINGQWSAHVWDVEAGGGVGGYADVMLYTPVTINRPTAVWGRVDLGAWVAASATDDNSSFDEQFDEEYTVILPGTAGATNPVEIAIMDRWGAESYRSPTPVDVFVQVPPSTLGAYESNDASVVDLFDTIGAPGGWSVSSPDLGYSGVDNTTMIASGTGSEACFTIDGSEVEIRYSNESTSTANVYVDSEFHSTIEYAVEFPLNPDLGHYIANLPDGYHTIKIVATGSGVTFDAFTITDELNLKLINATVGMGDIEVADNGYYENTKFKIKYAGAWNSIALDTSARPDPPNGGDSSGHESVRPYDRVYAFFKNADTAAIYRKVSPGGGTASVYMDGKFRGTMNNNAAFTAVEPFYIGGLDPNGVIHTLEVRINTGAPTFDFDTLRLLNLLVQPPAPQQLYAVLTPGGTLDVPYNAPLETYGTWTTNTTGGFIQGNLEGNLLNIFFQGNAIAARVKTDTLGMGKFEMYVDGKFIRTVDLKTAFAKDVPIVAHGFDPDLPHVLQIRHINANPASPKKTIYYGFRVYYIPPVGPGLVEEYEYDGSGNPTQSAFIYEQSWKFLGPITKIPGPSGQRLIETKHKEARAYLYFTGVDTFTAYFATKDIYKTAEIWVDGALIGTLNLYTATTPTYNHPFTVTDLDPAKTHFFELRVQNELGKIALDRVVLYNRPTLVPGVYENDGLVDTVGGGACSVPSLTCVPAMAFSGRWQRALNAAASGGNYEASGKPPDKVVFEVTGATSVVVYRRLRSTYGFIDVYVDDKYYTSFNNYVANPAAGVYQQPFVIAGLNPAFNHQIRILPQPFGALLTKGKPYDIDWIEVRTGDAPGDEYLDPGFYENNDGAALAGGAISYIGNNWTFTTDGLSKATTVGNKAMVVFNGNAFTVNLKKTGTGGKVELRVDGQYIGQMDLLGNAVDVPFSAVGLESGIHTAEIYVKASAVNINSYRVYNLTPDTMPTYDLTLPVPNGILLTEEWFMEGGFLTTRKPGARLYAYVTGGDSAFLTTRTGFASAHVQVYVDSELHTTIDKAYIQATPAAPPSEYLIGGMDPAAGHWIAIQKLGDGKISLDQLRIGDLPGPFLGDGESAEAEPNPDGVPPSAVVRRMGTWSQKPATADLRYSGKFYLQSVSRYASFYLPVQGVESVTVYRRLADIYGNALVYIDGELWGTMPNFAATTQHSVPFVVGPIPDPGSAHIIEFRHASAKVFALDHFTGSSAPILEPGFYEDSHPAFLGGLDPDTGLTYPKAYIGNWSAVTNASASGGTMRKGAGKGSRLTVAFTGNQVTLYRRTWLYGGRTTVYVDGTAYPINNKTATTMYQVPHTIVLPTNGPHSLDIMVDSYQTFFDAIEFGYLGAASYGSYQHDDSHVVVNTLTNTWTETTDVAYSGGSYIWTKTKYDSVFFRFYGTRVTAYWAKGVGWGRVSIYLDGQFYEEVSQFTKNVNPPIPLVAYDISGLPLANHTLEIRFEKKKDSHIQSLARANLDAITVDGAPVPPPGEPVGPGPDTPKVGCFEEQDSRWALTGPAQAWTIQLNASASGDAYYAATAWPDVSAVFRFSASGFSLIYHKEPGGAQADVKVDGVVVDTLDMNSSGNEWLVVYSYSGLNPNALHTVEIIHKGGGNIFIDRLDLPSFNVVYNDACPIH